MILDIDHVILVVHSAATVAGVVVLFHAVKTDGSANPVGAQVVPHKPLVTVIAALGLEVPSLFEPARLIQALCEAGDSDG